MGDRHQSMQAIKSRMAPNPARCKIGFEIQTMRLSTSLEDEALHRQICPCEVPGSKECALQTGRVSVSGADAVSAEMCYSPCQEQPVGCSAGPAFPGLLGNT